MDNIPFTLFLFLTSWKVACAHAFYQNVLSSSSVFDHPKQCGVNYFLFHYFYHLPTLSNSYLSFKEQYYNPVWIQNLSGFKPYITIRKYCDATAAELICCFWHHSHILPPGCINNYPRGSPWNVFTWSLLKRGPQSLSEWHLQQVI